MLMFFYDCKKIATDTTTFNDVFTSPQNGTFIGPVFAVPCMMFAGFGVTLRDLPPYLKWGSYVSYLRYGLEGYVGALFYNRDQLECDVFYCHYK